MQTITQIKTSTKIAVAVVIFFVAGMAAAFAGGFFSRPKQFNGVTVQCTDGRVSIKPGCRSAQEWNDYANNFCSPPRKLSLREKFTKGKKGVKSVKVGKECASPLSRPLSRP